MIRASVTFLAGALVTTGAAIYAGGAMRAGILIGAAIIVATLATWPRRIAHLLLAGADALDTFTTRRDELARPTRKNKIDKPAAAPAIVPVPAVQDDVAKALAGLGVPRKQAERAARMAAEAGAALDFEPLFRAAIDLVRVKGAA